MNILLIGGYNDIGISLAKYLKKKGYNVIIGYHNNIPKDNKFEYIECNVINEESITKCFKILEKEYQKFNVINLANICRDNYFLDKKLEEFIKVLGTDLIGAFSVNRIYTTLFSNGILINIGSTDGIDTGNVYNVDYSISKSGVITLSRIIDGLNENKVYCICPNWIDSNTTNEMDKHYLNNELKRIGQGRLIKKEEFNETIYDTLNGKYKGIIRLDIKGDKLWIKEI